MFPQVDPFAESTWRNYPRPCDFPTFERELRALGGTHLSGRPMLRLQWAPDAFRFQLGRPRRYYVDTRIPTRRKLLRMYYQVKEIADPFAPWLTVEPDDLGKYPGEAFLHVVHHDAEIVTIARQQWVIEQYFPPDRLGDTPESWEARRFRFFTPPETNVPVFGDECGPFPGEGEYRSVLIIEGNKEFAYRPPCAIDLEVLSAAKQLREHHRRTVSRDAEVKNAYQAHEEKEQRRLQELSDRLDDELKPYDRAAEGNAFISVP